MVSQWASCKNTILSCIFPHRGTILCEWYISLRPLPHKAIGVQNGWICNNETVSSRAGSLFTGYKLYKKFAQRTSWLFHMLIYMFHLYVKFWYCILYIMHSNSVRSQQTRNLQLLKNPINNSSSSSVYLIIKYTMTTFTWLSLHSKQGMTYTNWKLYNKWHLYLTGIVCAAIVNGAWYIANVACLLGTCEW